MPNLINKMLVRELSDAFDGAEGMVIVSLAGLTVAETEAIRNELAEHGVSLRMVRNRLARIALASRGVEAPRDVLSGNVAFVWGDPEAAIHAAKVIAGSEAKKKGKVAFKGGLLEGNLLAADEAGALATLPGRQELRAMLLGCLVGPAQSLVRILQAPQSSLARVVQAHVDAQAEAAPEA